MLKRPVSDLVDVDEKASKTLVQLGIHTIFDLATSPIFISANNLVAEDGAYTRFLEKGFLPPQVLDQSVGQVWPEDIPGMDIEKLAIIGEKTGQGIRRNLGVNNICELANWEPFVVASRILSSTFPATTLEADPEMPEDLLPSVGDYPTEKVFYRRYFLDEIIDSGSSNETEELTDLLAEGQLDIMKNYQEKDTIGFTHPMVGVEVYASQSWYAKGVALGQLLHSMALAPGESTRIAVMDWSRRTGARVAESMTEAEQLAANTDQNRSISEVTNGVANESQHGESAVANTSLGFQVGSSESGSALGFYNASGSQGMSVNTSIASNVNRTSVSRDVAARTQQAINDTTHQQSMAARTRRATVVQETYEKESETATTRVVTNYNHMHAMSVQYYEVVQIYEVKTEIERMERMLYVPMKAFNFSDSRVISRFKNSLYPAIKEARFRKIMSTWNGDYQVVFNQMSSVRKQTEADFVKVTKEIQKLAQDLNKKIAATRDEGRSAEIQRLTKEFEENEAVIELRQKYGPLSYLLLVFGSINKATIDRLQQSLLLPKAIDPEQEAIPFSLDVSLTEVWVYVLEQKKAEGRIAQDIELIFSHPPGGQAEASLSLRSSEPSNIIEDESTVYVWNELNINLSDYGSVRINSGFDLQSSEAIIIHFKFRRGDEEFSIPWLCRPMQGQPLEILSLKTNPEEAPLIDHLNDNRLHYSQAIWSSMDRQTLSQMLANYKINGRSIGNYIDPQPVAVTGNLMGFRWHFANEDEEQEFEKNYKHNVDDNKPITIPLPSGGVFAEAVLGRYNCAEKLDLTRFWNWQDSPIPIVAPEIAPIQTGQRQGMEAPTTGYFGQPMAQLQQLNQLPDPSGIAEVLKALSTPNLFKDLSGLQATVDLAKTGATQAGEGAQSASEQANEAMKIGTEHQRAMVQSYLQHQQKMAETIMPLVAGAVTGGAGAVAGSISKAGAVVNMAGKMDKQGNNQASGGSSNLLSTFASLFGGLIGKLKK